MTPTDSAVLERELLRKSVDALQAGRHHCGDCGRTPLIGERVYAYPGGREVCELCRALRREPEESSQIVRSSEFGHAVRLTVRASPDRGLRGAGWRAPPGDDDGLD